MSRVKRGTMASKKRKHLLQYAKGYRWGRKSKFRAAKDATKHAWEYAFRDRKAKKGERRALWQIQINAACRKSGIPYNKFIFCLKKNKIELDRKVLSGFAKDNPQIFSKLLELTK
jgi:large subunit ribosomal protein L20